MAQKVARQTREKSFNIVRTVGLTLPDVEDGTRYDGSPVLRLGGCFMAGLATHRSAEPHTLVVRVAFDERDLLLEDAPETYYVTDYYRSIHLCWCVCRVSIDTCSPTCSQCHGG